VYSICGTIYLEVEGTQNKNSGVTKMENVKIVALRNLEMINDKNYITDMFFMICDTVEIEGLSLKIINDKTEYMGRFNKLTNVVEINIEYHETVRELHDTICHEIAHYTKLRHCKTHTDLTEKYVKETKWVM